MRDERCIMIEELLPLYIENATGEEAADLIGEHLKTCDECRDSYKKMTTGLEISVRTSAPKKGTIRYINSVKLWYLICPLTALLLVLSGMEEALRIYKGILLLISGCFIASDIFHKGTWWDQECIRLQDEIRQDARGKWGAFYIRPIWIALPGVLVVIALELPRILSW